ncbi:menaquinone biosynthesis protein [Thermodesulfovibrionales bacterium]|nr:menaquinone biosynthesis protein [Thermodesulfovibrionales bacterium]
MSDKTAHCSLFTAYYNMNNRLKIGKIPYTNLFPVFYTLEKEFDCSMYEFVEGVPSMLNKMLRERKIDISPSSSIEYLKKPSLYHIIVGHSISSRGAVGSILLFSGKPIEELNDGVVHVSSQSETSVALLDIIFKKFYEIRCRLRVSENPEKSGGDAFLLIGDDALKQSSKFRGGSSELIYDLGEIWRKNTGLSFVFALWIARAGEYKKRNLLNKLIKDLGAAKDIASKNLHGVAGHSPMKEFISEDELINYWNKIDYDLTEEHKRGLELFRTYLKEFSYF